ncbi:MAG: hypothetical protein HRT90_06680 [Candidatus Margulisbacteria bacterium]|nr:hypothetical protein [Candidatus Margulisiibacteriota bacterium]
MIEDSSYKITEQMKSSWHKSVRLLAKSLGFSKSAIHRHQQKVNRRSGILGADYFETADGQKWILKFVAATILVFGVAASVGSDRIALFISLLGLSYFAALSADSLRKIENKIDTLIAQYKDRYDALIKEKASELEITPGADETYLSGIMYLVLMDLQSGFIFTEEIKDKRDHETWEAVSTPWISKFKIVRCFLSDKAKALLKLADKTFQVIRIPDLFHMMNDLSSVMKFSFNRIQKSIESEIKKLAGKARQTRNIKEKLADLKDKLASVLLDQRTYQKHLRNLSLTLHPFTILSSGKQNSKAAASAMQSSLSTIKKIKDKHDIPDPRNKMKRVEKEIPAAAQQIDQWWVWVETSLDGLDCTQEFKDWMMFYLLPFVYWKAQIKKTNSKIIRRFYKLSYRNSEAELEKHQLTIRCFSNLKYTKWAISMAKIFIRSTSAIEGRNGWLSQIHFNGRGLPEKRLISQTGIRNYFLTRTDGTTACERLSGIEPECLFKYIVDNLDPLSSPRIGKKMKLPPPFMQQAVPP